MMAKRYRLVKKTDFQRIYRQGQKVTSPLLMMKYLPNRENYSRFGIVVSSKVAKQAVIRNKIKRRIGEILRNNQARIPTGYDFVVISSPRAKQSNNQDIVNNLRKLFSQVDQKT